MKIYQYSAVVALALTFMNPSLAVSNQELMDRLDDIELDMQMRETQRLMDEAQRQINRQRQNNSQQGNSQSSIGGGRYVMLRKYDDKFESKFYIDTNSIKKAKNGNTLFIFINTTEKPRYLGGGQKAYFNTRVLVEMNCYAKKSQNVAGEFLLRDFTKVADMNPEKEMSTFDSSYLIHDFYKYVCN
jgi:hypothetical protein